MLSSLPKTSLEKIHENKKQPNLQISIMKAIALNGAMTKPKLAKMLNSKNTSIATTITKDQNNEPPLRLFEKLKDFELIKSIQQPLFQLTDFGMSMLLVSHYKKTDKGSIQQPLLNYKEFLKLISISKQKHNNIYNDFKTDSLLEIIAFQYINANTTIYDKLVIEHKNNSKINELKTTIKSDEEAIKSDEEAIKSYEINIKKLKRERQKKRNVIAGLLSESFISALEKHNHKK